MLLATRPIYCNLVKIYKENVAGLENVSSKKTVGMENTGHICYIVDVPETDPLD